MKKVVLGYVENKYIHIPEQNSVCSHTPHTSTLLITGLVSIKRWAVSVPPTAFLTEHVKMIKRRKDDAVVSHALYQKWFSLNASLLNVMCAVYFK